MNILGIETSCDETAAAVVRDGKEILSSRVATQIPHHRPYSGVVPEVASRLHTEWISRVVQEALDEAGLKPEDLDGTAAASQPGLVGSLLVGLSFAKAFAWARGLPFVGVDHVKAHLYAPRLAGEAEYPFLGLLVSGGHTLIARVDSFDSFEVLGATIDDACGEAFDKVAKYYGLGYPGGKVIDELAARGDPGAYRFPQPRLKVKRRPCDLSYSGLKTAVTGQLNQFLRPGYQWSPENLAASFQKAAVDMLISQVEKAVELTGITRVTAGGGVAANSLLRRRLAGHPGFQAIYPPLSLCTDNGAMIAGLAFPYLQRGDRSPWGLNAASRVRAFKGYLS